jgi:DNA-binding NarL/FixJ family response regulator
MRVILVGTPASRARARRQLDEAGVEIGAEFDTLAAARASDVAADGILLAQRALAASASDEGWIEQPLTPREIEVLQLLAEGLSNKSIAARLGISDQTVKFHVASITSKLGASNRTDAVRLALRRGLITV